MITVTRLNHSHIVLNSDLIEQIETTPDTVISMTSGQKFMVLESAEEIIRRIIDFRRAVMRPSVAGAPAPSGTRGSSAGVPEDKIYGED